MKSVNFIMFFPNTETSSILRGVVIKVGLVLVGLIICKAILYNIEYSVYLPPHMYIVFVLNIRMDNSWYYKNYE